MNKLFLKLTMAASTVAHFELKVLVKIAEFVVKVNGVRV